MKLAELRGEVLKNGVEHEGLTPIETLLIWHILDLDFNGKGFSWPGREKLRKRLNLKNKTSITNMVTRLEKKGFIKRKEKPGHTNDYDWTPLIARFEKYVGGSSENEGGIHPKMKGGSSENEGGVHPKMKGGSSENEGGVHPRMKQSSSSNLSFLSSSSEAQYNPALSPEENCKNIFGEDPNPRVLDIKPEKIEQSLRAWAIRRYRREWNYLRKHLKGYEVSDYLSDKDKRSFEELAGKCGYDLDVWLKVVVRYLTSEERSLKGNLYPSIWIVDRFDGLLNTVESANKKHRKKAFEIAKDKGLIE